MSGVIGTDNLTDYAHLQALAPAEMAKATAKQIDLKYVTEFNEILFAHPARQLQNLCPGERFANQSTLGGCSGFLIAPDVLVTAGHCADYASAGCGNEAWLFNHFQNNPIDGKYQFAKTDLYRCIQVLTSRHDNDADYAVLRLERAVLGASPFKPDRANSIKPNDALAVLGYPLGLSFFYAPGGSVLKIDANLLHTDLDAYDKNSGSAVLNLRTGLVDGIVTNGFAGLSINPIDGCLETKFHQKAVTLANRLSQIPELSQWIDKPKHNFIFTINNTCSEPMRVVSKYRAITDNSLKTSLVILPPQETLTIESKNSVFHVHAANTKGEAFIKGTDFYGFTDGSHNEEIGFKKMSEPNIALCPKVH